MNKLTVKLFAIMILACAVFAPALFAEGQRQIWREHRVTVCHGDTVWALAAGFADKGEDVREVVERIYKVNNLGARAAIQPGQTLVVPVRSESGKMHVAMND